MAFLNPARVAAAVGLLVSTLMVCAPPMAAQAPLEAEVKAVFLFNFAKYVDWRSVPQSSSETIRMCVPAGR